MNTIEKTEYPVFSKVVLESNGLGLMLSAEYYNELIALGMTDETVFDAARWE